MTVEDTKQENVKCSKCGENKSPERIVKNRKICKDCCNKKKAETAKKNLENIDNTENRVCSKCDKEKNITLFLRKGLSRICIECDNNIRREKYNNNDELRKKTIKDSTEFKKKKKEERDKIKEKELKELEDKIGKENTICKYCKKVKPKDRFRHNRLKCKDCERDGPKEKFNRNIRSRIYLGLKKNKPYNTIHYLECTTKEYIKWIAYHIKDFTLENFGKQWHVDHVIPLSRFNLQNKKDLYLAFNWRNTMPLYAKENLAKNNKIIPQQIKRHLKTLEKYHEDNNMKLPQEFKDLYAKHLEAGNPLELKLPLSTGNCKKGTRLTTEPKGNNV